MGCLGSAMLWKILVVPCFGIFWQFLVLENFGSALLSYTFEMPLDRFAMPCFGIRFVTLLICLY